MYKKTMGRLFVDMKECIEQYQIAFENKNLDLMTEYAERIKELAKQLVG